VASRHELRDELSAESACGAGYEDLHDLLLSPHLPLRRDRGAACDSLLGVPVSTRAEHAIRLLDLHTGAEPEPDVHAVEAAWTRNQRAVPIERTRGRPRWITKLRPIGRERRRRVRTVLYTSISCDGFIARANESPEQLARGRRERSPIADRLEKERQMAKIALSQNISLDGVMRFDGLVQSPGPTDVPFKYTGWNLTPSTAVPRVADSATRKSSGSSRRRTPRRFCSAGSPTRPCRATGRRRKVSLPRG
jgi:hypothetical protein